jgi:UDP-N-acetylglucosamine--N-acetylmuramyl-(pentapeptide) pyrophosphoryl-undecaprenol N-acetylglucosamine transferase
MDRNEILARLAALGRPVRLIVSGGGTGGHTFPAVTTIRTARALLDEAGIALDVLYVGTATGLEARVAEQEGLRFKAIRTGKLRRASNPLQMLSAANLRDAGRVPLGVAAAVRIVGDYKPDAVLCTGGYVCVPIGLAAKLARRPLLVHEQTVRLGLANRILARRATRVALSSPSSVGLLPARVQERAVVTGNPIRPQLADGDPQKALKTLDWTGWELGLPTVYVTGGAQGAAQINNLVGAVLPDLLKRANVVHQCGARSLEEIRATVPTLPDELRGRYRLVDFVGAELPDVFALADIVISRSGAGTLAELTALGKPSVLVPLIPSSGNEQEHNARHLAEAGASRALVGSDATPENLWAEMEPLLGDGEQRARMAQAARALGHPNAAEALAASLLELCAKG